MSGQAKGDRTVPATAPGILGETHGSPLRRRNLPWRNPDLLCPALLVFLGILFFADPVFSDRNFYFRDIFTFHYPLRRVLIDAWSQWQFPLWNPFIDFGQPMLANPNYMAFYPTNLFHLVLPFNYAFKLHFIIHPILAGIGLYFLQRRLGISAMPSLVGALIYEFSGTVLSFLNLYNILPAVALLPWIAWTFLGAFGSGRLRKAFGFGLLLALQVIAFEPIMFLCNVFLIGGLAFHVVLESEDRRSALGRAVKVLAAGAGFALGISALQVWPTLELLPHSGRGQGFDFRTASQWSVHPTDLINLAIPNLFGNYYSLGLATSWGEPIHEGAVNYLVSFFLGVTALSLVAAAFIFTRRRLLWTLSGIAFVSGFLALGKFNPLNHWVFDHLIIFRIGRYPSKYFLLTTLALSIMSGLGLEALLKPAEKRHAIRARLTILGGSGILLGAFLLFIPAAWSSAAPHIVRWMTEGLTPAMAASKDFQTILSILHRSILTSGCFLIFSGAAMIAVPFFREVRQICALFLALIVGELLPPNLQLTPLISGADLNFVPEVNQYLRHAGEKEIFRTAPPTILRPIPDLYLKTPNRSAAWVTLFSRLSGQPFFGIANGIQYSAERAVDHLGTRESASLWAASNTLPLGPALALLGKMNTPAILVFGALNDPGVRLAAAFETGSDQKINLYWKPDSLRRAYFAAASEKAASPTDALRRFAAMDFPAGNTVILEGPGAESGGDPEAHGAAAVERYEACLVSCSVKAEKPGYLVLVDSFYPGWQATVDGSDVEIFKANYAFRAVRVPAGEHKVEFRFRPLSFFIGLAISIFSAGLGLALILFTRS
jgi:hypothetical protein